MSHRPSVPAFVPKRALNHVRRRRRRRWRLSAYVGASLGALALAVAVTGFMFRGAILNHYGKGKLERAFAEAYPGSVLRLGALDYAVGVNRLVADSVTLTSTDSTLKVGRVSLTGVRWARLLRGAAPLAEVLAQASLEATNLTAEFPRSQYGLRCARLRASVPGSELIAEGTELQPLVGDEELFASDRFRKTRFRVVVPECKVLGLEYGELFRGTSCRAKWVHFSRPSFDALVNRDKPVKPFVTSPLMVHEALASIRHPLQVDSLRITNGHLTYCERVFPGADPGVLTFGAVNMSVAGIANRASSRAAILLQGQGNLMEAGTLTVRLSIPITPPDLSLHYSGSLTAMDLTLLNAFIDIAERTRIKSGSAQAAAFDIQVTAGQAHGWVRATYRNLEVAVLDKRTGSEHGLDDRVASFLANTLKVRNANAPDASGAMKEGKVDYTREPADQFMEFVWSALWSGVRDVVSH